MNTYLIFGRLSSCLRNILTVFLIFIGYLLQITSRNILTGLPFILLCVILNLIRNFSTKEIKPSKFEWKEVTPEKIEEVYKHCERLKKIQDGNLGCDVFVIFLFSGIIFFMPLILDVLSKIPFAIIALIVDSFIIFGGLLFSGIHSVWIPNNLYEKISIIRRMLKHKVLLKTPQINIVPYLEVGNTKEGSFPNDTRMLIKFKDAPEDFIGLQFQISINKVRRALYPYCYCVIIAKESFNLLNKFKPVELHDITIERETSGEVDVIIIRQTTSISSGYHTSETKQDYILTNSINIVTTMLLEP